MLFIVAFSVLFIYIVRPFNDLSGHNIICMYLTRIINVFLSFLSRTTSTVLEIKETSVSVLISNTDTSLYLNIALL